MSLNQSANRSDVLDTAFVAGTIGVNSNETLASVSGTNLSERQTLLIYNDSAKTIYYGPTGVQNSGANKGIPIEPEETVVLNVGEYIEVYLTVQSGNNNAIIQEYA